MRFYKTTYNDNSTACATWDKSASDASRHRVALKKDGMRSIETKAVDVPTDKTGLLGWLNANAMDCTRIFVQIARHTESKHPEHVVLEPRDEAKHG